MASSSLHHGHGLSSPQELASYLLDQSNPEHNQSAVEHRHTVISAWKIPPGSAVLEIGCGQGEFTVALADAVGPDGSVVAVDPAALGWEQNEMALTMAVRNAGVVNAQAHLATSSVGSRVELLNLDSVAYLTSSSSRFDFIVFGYSVWFFSDPRALPNMFHHARALAHTVLLVTFSYATSLPAAFPHILAVQYNATLEAVMTKREVWNVRCALSPPQITRAVQGAGWTTKTVDERVTPSSSLLDAWREVSRVVRSPGFRAELEHAQLDEPIQSVLFAMRDAVEASVARLEGGIKSVRNMDAWIARFELSGLVVG